MGALDAASGQAGLLIVSGGNEVRAGPHRSMALLAHRIAAAGFPVFRFDRRGVGDSSGINQGFENSGEDIAAATKIFRQEASLARVVAFGNGDGATALALFHAQARIDSLLLANPVTKSGIDAAAPETADQGDSRGWMRQVIGRISGRRADSESTLVARLAEALTDAKIPITLLLATRDPVGALFADLLHRPAFAALSTRVRRKQFNTDSHSFAGSADKAWLYERILEALAE